MTKKEQSDWKKNIRHWIETSDNDYETMNSLYNSKSYNWSLFIGHIVIEKLLKAYYTKTKNEHPPFTHNLFRIAELSGL